MAPGMPVRAEDWNTVVGAIIDVARLVTTEAFAAPPHTHAGLVSREWLDPSLVDFVDTTRERQQVHSDQVKALEQRMYRVETRLDAVDRTVKSLQSQADREADLRLDRDISLKRLGERVDGHDVLASQLGDLNTRLGQLEPRIDDAVSLRRELTGPNGALPDFGRLEDEVKELSGLRENLRLADGSLGRLRDLERRLDTFEQLGTNTAVLDARIESGIQSSLTTRGLDAASLDRLISERIDPVTTSVSDVTAAVDVLQAAVDRHAGAVAGATSRIGALETLATSTADLPARVATLDSFRTSAGATLAGLQSDVNTALALRDRVDSLETGAAALDQRLGAFVTQDELGRVEETLKAVTTRTETLEEQAKTFATREELLRIEERIGDKERELATLGGRVDVLQASTRDFQDLTTTRLQNFDGRVSALTESNARLSLDLGRLNQRVDAIRPNGRIVRGGDG